MSYICDRCGEMIKDNELCTCLISEKKEALKKRNKKYYLRKKFTDNLTENILKSREIKEEINEFLNIDFNKISEDKYLNQEIQSYTEQRNALRSAIEIKTSSFNENKVQETNKRFDDKYMKFVEISEQLNDKIDEELSKK